MPAPDGSRHQFAARQMLDTTSPALDYIYEDISDPLAGQERLSVRLQTLGIAIAADRESAMPKAPEVELLGANAHPVLWVGQAVDTSVRMDKPTSQKVLESFRANDLAMGMRRARTLAIQSEAQGRQLPNTALVRQRHNTERLGRVERRQQAGQARRQHRLPRARRPDHQPRQTTRPSSGSGSVLGWTEVGSKGILLE
jgi:hypothetical protein